jgi:hypothetical protein
MKASRASPRGKFWLKSGARVALAFTGLASAFSVCAQTNVSLELVGCWRPSSGGSVNRVFMVGDYAFVGSEPDGLEIIDVADPTNPTRVGGIPTGGSAYGIQVIGSYAFVANYGKGLQIFDVSKVQTPQPIGGDPAGGFSYELEVLDGYAFVGDFFRGLEIYDVNVRPNPVLMVSLPIGGNAFGVRVLGDYAYVAAGSGGLKIVNVANKAAPSLVGAWNDAVEIWDVDVSGDFAFLASPYRGLDAIDIADPSQPRLAASLSTKGHPAGIRVVGTRVFVADYDGAVQVIDVAQPQQPILVGLFQTTGSARAVEVVGSYGYVADGGGGLLILSITERPIGIAEQPGDIQVQTGQTAVFSATAVSVAPFTYRWQKEGADLKDDGRIVGATASTLAISNAMASDQGYYSVTVSNGYGSVASSNACLSVVPGLREALDDTNLVWSTWSIFGNGVWKLQFAVTHDGVDAAQSGPLQAGIWAGRSSLATTVRGPGTLRFWWKLEDTTCFQLSFFVGTDFLTQNGPWGVGAADWEQRVFRIPSGPQNLEWVFETLCGDGSPPGSAWLDEVQYTPDQPPLITRQPEDLSIRSGETVSLQVNVGGSEPLSFQWYEGQSGDTTRPIANATSSTWTAANLTVSSSYWVLATNAVGAVQSRTATVTVVSALSILAVRDQDVMLEVSGPAGASARIQFSTNLISWGSPSGPDLLLDGGRTTTQIRKPDENRAFFRSILVR